MLPFVRAENQSALFGRVKVLKFPSLSLIVGRALLHEQLVFGRVDGETFAGAPVPQRRRLVLVSPELKIGRGTLKRQFPEISIQLWFIFY